jgi:hypothetical protein
VPIDLKCECGATCSAEESQLGQTVKCPACGKDVPVQAPANAPTAEVMAEGPSAMRDLQSTVGHGDVSEMIAQITGKRPVEGQADAAAPAASGAASQPGSPAGAPSASAGGPAAPAPAGSRAAVVAAMAKDTPKPKRKLPTGTARAAHHIGFKRLMWRVAVLVGLVCAGFAVYCFLPKSGPAVPPEPDFPVNNGDLSLDEHGKAWAMPKGATPSPQKSGKMCYYFAAVEQEGLSLKDMPNHEIITDAAGRCWAIPQGAEPRPQADGRMCYRLKAKGADGARPKDGSGDGAAPKTPVVWWIAPEQMAPAPTVEDKTESPAKAAVPEDQDLPAVSVESPEEAATSVDNWMEARKSRERTLSDIRARDAYYTNFGIVFAAVALALLALGAWMWTDVRIVRRAEEARQAAAAPPSPEKASAGAAAPPSEKKT